MVGYTRGYEEIEKLLMSGIPLQTSIIYGPIFSRRLGRSLGINLSGVDGKVCSFNCVYCQYGRAEPVQPADLRTGMPSIDEVLSQVERAMKKPRTIDYLTFSGNGEPTLHPEFPEIVRGVLALRDQYRPEARLAVLSNASRVTEPEIRSALQLLDAPMMKLDAGDEKTFRAINCPAHSVSFAEVIAGLKEMPNLMIQSMMLEGKITNVRGEAFEAWANLVAELNPGAIHIYSLDRPAAFGGVDCVSAARLEEIAADLRSQFQLEAFAFS